MSAQEGNKKRHLSGEEGGASPLNQGSIKHPKIVPVVPVTYPGSNQDIPWPCLLRPLSLINAVHLESVSATFQKSVFAGQHRLVWNFKYRNFLVDHHGLLKNTAPSRNKALLFLVKKIRLFCRQLVIKELQHPTNDREIFSNLPKLESVYLKYGKPAKMKEEITLDVMSNSFKSFLKNAETRLSALENTGNAEIRINCDPSACPANLSRATMSLGRVLQAFGAFLAERKESLRSLQLAPFEAYYKRYARVKSLFQLDIETLKFPDNSYRLSKLRVAYQRESPENTTRSGQYHSVLKAVVEHLDTLYIKWGEENRLDLLQIGRCNAFLHPLNPIWANRLRRNCAPIRLRALAIDFNWVNVSFENENLHRGWFNQSWTFVGETLGFCALNRRRFRKLSLSLPYNPEAQEQGCFYFSEAFIQAFVQNQSLNYLRLVLKAWPGVALKFGPVELVTLEISFACFKAKEFSQELVQAAKNGSGDHSKRGILFDLECDFWKASHFAASVRSLKLKYAPYFDQDLATHLATAFPNLVMFSFAAFNRQVYNQGDFVPGLIRLLERIYSLRVIKLDDSFDKSNLDLLPLLRDMQARAHYDTGRFVFYARKATVDERSQEILDNSRRVGSNFRITVETYPRIQVQEEMQFPSEKRQSSPSLPEFSNVHLTPPQLLLRQPSPTVASSRASSPRGLPQAASGLHDYPRNPSDSISPHNRNLAPNVRPAANVSGHQPTYQLQGFMPQQPPQFPNERPQNAPMHLFQNAPNFTYQQTLPQLVSLPQNPTVATYRSPLSGGLLHDELDFSYFNDSPQNVQPAANIPGNQAVSPFPIQQAANQSQHSPPPAAESTTEIDEFARMLTERFNKDPNK